MRFFPNHGVGVLARHGRPVALQQQTAASGFFYTIYTNGRTMVRGKGSERLTLIGRMAPIRCDAR